MRTLFAVLRRLEEWVLVWGILVIASVTIANAFSRTVLNTSLASAEEISQFFIVLVTFLGLSHAAGRGRHIRMSALYDQLGDRSRKILMIAIAAGTALLMFVMAWTSARYVATVYSFGTVSPVLQVPLFWIYAAAPIGFFVAGLQYILTIVRNLREETVYLSWESRDEYEELPTS